jgi:hypothetical protein
MISIHFLRIVASFTLLGAVIVGVVTGAMEREPVDPRLFGAVIGLIVGVFVARSGRETRSI